MLFDFLLEGALQQLGGDASEHETRIHAMLM